MLHLTPLRAGRARLTTEGYTEADVDELRDFARICGLPKNWIRDDGEELYAVVDAGRWALVRERMRMRGYIENAADTPC